MSEADKVFSGSIPEFYDTYLVPLIFEEFARDIAGRVLSKRPEHVLEIAAGSGVVTREIVPGLPASATYTVTDLNQPMLDHAASKQDPDDRITWRQADALALPFPDQSFDVVFCQFGVMFFPDRVAGYSEARRVLKPGGRYFFNVWDRIEENEFADVITAAAATVFPDDPPRFLARTPHGYYDTAQIEQELGKAGFSHIAIHALDALSHGTSARHPAVAYCQGTPLRGEIEARNPELLDKVTDVATQAIADRFGDGPVSGKIRGFVIEAGV